MTRSLLNKEGRRHSKKESCCGQWRNQEFFRGGGISTNSVEDRVQTERGSEGDSPLVRVLEAAVIWYKKFHFLWQNILNFWYFKTIYDNLFLIVNVKQLRT